MYCKVDGMPFMMAEVGGGGRVNRRQSSYKDAIDSGGCRLVVGMSFFKNGCRFGMRTNAGMQV